MLRGYHSLPKAGTEYTPQWMKIPNFASRYHSGTRYPASSDSHVARYGPAAIAWSTAARVPARVRAAGVCAGSAAATKNRVSEARACVMPGTIVNVKVAEKR